MNKDVWTGVALVFVLPIVLVGSVLIALPFGLWNAYVLSSLWAWFVVPLGLPVLGVWHTFGLIMMLNALKVSSDKKQENSKLSDAVARLFANSIVLLVVLGIAFFVKGQM